MVIRLPLSSCWARVGLVPAHSAAPQDCEVQAKTKANIHTMEQERGESGSLATSWSVMHPGDALES